MSNIAILYWAGFCLILEFLGLYVMWGLVFRLMGEGERKTSKVYGWFKKLYPKRFDRIFEWVLYPESLLRFLRLLLLLFKRASLVIGTLAGVVFFVILISTLGSEAVRVRNEYLQIKEAQRRAAEKVHVMLSYNNSNENYPIVVCIHNFSNKVVEEVTWKLKVYVPEYRTDSIGRLFGPPIFNRFMAPKFNYEESLLPKEHGLRSYSLPSHINRSSVAPNDLIYKVEDVRIKFKE